MVRSLFSGAGFGHQSEAAGVHSAQLSSG